MKSLVKICGLTRPQDVETALLYGADFLGFIVEAESPRKLSVSEAAKLSLPAREIAQRVAVTVNADDDLIAKIMAEMAPDYIQFHGDEPPGRLAHVSSRFGVKAIKAMKIRSREDLKIAETFAGVADIILYDAPPPDGSVVQGGHGASFDWTLLCGAPLPKLWALAGGLTPDNVAAAITATHAPMVDVSSGVEAAPGVKDAAKMEHFIIAAHSGKIRSPSSDGHP